jgi:hypothetical protein
VPEAIAEKAQRGQHDCGPPEFVHADEGYRSSPPFLLRGLTARRRRPIS